MKFYNVELNNPETITKFRYFLKSNNIYFETSAAGSYTHFEVKLNAETLDICNNWLDNNA